MRVDYGYRHRGAMDPNTGQYLAYTSMAALGVTTSGLAAAEAPALTALMTGGSLKQILSQLAGKTGLTTPSKYFGSKTKKEVKEALEKKYGPPKSSRKHADTYYNEKTKRSYNVHEEKGHNNDKPHVDVRRRGGYEERKYDLKQDN